MGDTRVEDLDADLIAIAAETFAILADPTRIKIIRTLTEGEQSVNALAAAVNKPPAAVSQHLAKFRMARILLTRHDGNRVYYRLANEHVARLVTDTLHQAEHTLGQPRHQQA
jgi:DNA-binding transcriptional ArsR family regulator